MLFVYFIIIRNLLRGGPIRPSRDHPSSVRHRTARALLMMSYRKYSLFSFLTTTHFLLLLRTQQNAFSHTPSPLPLSINIITSTTNKHKHTHITYTQSDPLCIASNRFKSNRFSSYRLLSSHSVIHHHHSPPLSINIINCHKSHTHTHTQHTHTHTHTLHIHT